MNSMDRMKELIEVLNKAAKAYYQHDKEIMSNFEYDKLYDELSNLEKTSGTVLSNSPTIHVGYEVLSSLPKEKHPSKMLSLDKTKSVETIKEWLGNNVADLSWKMDGLTIVLTYDGGELVKAVTRGNGEVGEVITNNARMFKNIPHKISFTGELVVRGEAVISYKDFEMINESISDPADKYKNPRNLCSGSVRQLNAGITAERNVHFFAFTLVSAEGFDNKNSRMYQMDWLKSIGFDIVYNVRVTSANIEFEVKHFSDMINTNEYPSDGLVFVFDDIEYSKSLGATAKFPRDAIAFKWQDETAKTILRYIEWNASRTGLINPVAVFDPVELEGTTVSRASVHNVSIIEELQLGDGDEISVYKANMIIPQISDNHTRSGSAVIPDKCPSCGSKTVIMNLNGSKSLNCENPDCPAKMIKRFEYFVTRDAMNIEGLSTATLERFVDRGFIKEFADVFKIAEYKEEILNMEGFGERFYEKLIESLDKAMTVDPSNFISSLGITNVGLASARLICRAFKYDFNAIENASIEELQNISGIGPVTGEYIYNYFHNEKNLKEYNNLKAILRFAVPEMSVEDSPISGMIFTITGSLKHYTNRDELKKIIENLGGKVSESVSSKTSYLINNDVLSSSGKNKKAKELGIPVISEDDFMKKFNI